MRKKGLMGSHSDLLHMAQQPRDQTNRTSLNKEEERKGCYRPDIEKQRKRRKYMTMRGKLENNDSVKGWRKYWTDACDENVCVPGSPPAWRCPQTCHAVPLCCSPDAQCLCDALQSHSALVQRSLNPRSTTQTAVLSGCSMKRFWDYLVLKYYGQVMV